MAVAFEAEAVDGHNYLALCLLAVHVLGFRVLVLHIVAHKTVGIDESAAIGITECIERGIVYEVDVAKHGVYACALNAENVAVCYIDILVQREVYLLNIVEQLLAQQPNSLLGAVETGEFHHRQVYEVGECNL